MKDPFELRTYVELRVKQKNYEEGYHNRKKIALSLFNLSLKVFDTTILSSFVKFLIQFEATFIKP